MSWVSTRAMPRVWPGRGGSRRRWRAAGGCAAAWLAAWQAGSAGGLFYPCCPAEVLVAPAAVHIPGVKAALRPDFHVAAQNCWVKEGGAFTGEIR